MYGTNVCQCVRLLDTAVTLSPTKAAEPIEVLFEL